MSLPTASKWQLAATCPGSAVLPQVETEASEAAIDGTWKHAFLQAAAAKGREAALAEVPEEYREACADMDEALNLQLGGLGAELALAYDVERGTARVLGRGINRRYVGLGVSEVAMSLDFDGFARGVAVVVELKTGRGHVPGPESNWQVRLNALALARLHGVERAHVALLRAPEGQKPQWLEAGFDAFELEAIAHEARVVAGRLWEARAALKDGQQPKLSAGQWCRYCPARFGCPAFGGLIRQATANPTSLAESLAMGLTPSTAGEAWKRIKAVRVALAEVEAAIYAMASVEPVPLGEGRWLGQRERRREELDGRAVYAAVAQLHSRDLAAQAVDFSATKAGLSRALRALPGPLAPKVREVLDEVRRLGGATTKVTTSVTEYDERDE